VVTALGTNPAGLAVALFLAALGGNAVWLLVQEGSLARLGRDRLGRVLTRGLLIAFALELVLWGLRFAGLFGGPVSV
jgi:hypothetical protein